MNRYIAVLALVAFTAPDANSESHTPASPLRVLMTVGGVGYHTSIVRSLRANDTIALSVLDIDENPVLFSAATLANVDAVLMYHRDNVAEASEQAALLEFVDNGGGVVVLHHAVANYPGWEAWWRDHVGGLYALASNVELPPSEYFPDFRGAARPAADHPVTARLGSVWRYQDESYDRLWVSDEVEVLLSTTAFGSESRLAWIGPSPSKRVVYIQPGHGESVLTNPKYLVLIEDALRWTARSTD